MLALTFEMQKQILLARKRKQSMMSGQQNEVHIWSQNSSRQLYTTVSKLAYKTTSDHRKCTGVFTLTSEFQQQILPSRNSSFGQ